MLGNYAIELRCFFGSRCIMAVLFDTDPVAQIGEGVFAVVLPRGVGIDGLSRKRFRVIVNCRFAVF